MALRDFTSPLSFSVIALALLVGACGDDEPTDDTTTDTGGGTDTDGADTGVTDTGGSDGGVTDTGGGEGSCAPADALATTDVRGENYYRIERLKINEPRGVGAILEGLINNDIRLGKLHIIINITDFSAATGDATMQITGNAGVWDAATCSFAWYPGIVPNYGEGAFNDAGEITSNETISLIFPALLPNTDPPETLEIPLNEVAISGTLAADPENPDTLLLEGLLSGAILAENAADIEVELSPGNPQLLGELLGELNYPEGATGDALTGWKLEAEIRRAYPITFIPAEGSGVME